MLEGHYKFEKRNEANYDSIREYCVLEKVNEDHFRVLLKKEGMVNETAKQSKIIGNLLNSLKCRIRIHNSVIGINNESRGAL